MKSRAGAYSQASNLTLIPCSHPRTKSYSAVNFLDREEFGMQKLVAGSLASVLVAGQMLSPVVARAADFPTATPIQHLVVIFQENISFDHYFGTYPTALNPSGEPAFTALPNTPSVNGLSYWLRTRNPTRTPIKGGSRSNPFRLDRSQAATADQDHDYTPEQQAFDHGLMDLFPTYTGTAGAPPAPPPAIVATTGLVMGYYDGNTVTALWNYAQHFAMSDNSFDTNFGPSTVGAINLVSGQTNGVTIDNNPGGATISDGNGGFTDIGDADPAGDLCSSSTNLAMS